MHYKGTCSFQQIRFISVFVHPYYMIYKVIGNIYATMEIFFCMMYYWRLTVDKLLKDSLQDSFGEVICGN